MCSQLDAGALRQIEAIHRGFLYQHLFAVGCLLLARPAGVRALDVERDEDVQLVFDGRTRYVQVKTRQRPLTVGDLDSTLQRFREIKAAHLAGRRRGVPEFWVVTNSTASTALLEEVHRRDIDVRFVTPDNPPPTEAHSPPAWPDLGAAIRWCIDSAAQIQFTGLSPETLTWKLATEVAFACTGDRPRGHSFQADQLTELFDKLQQPRSFRCTNCQPRQSRTYASPMSEQLHLRVSVRIFCRIPRHVQLVVRAALVRVVQQAGISSALMDDHKPPGLSSDALRPLHCRSRRFAPSQPAHCLRRCCSQAVFLPEPLTCSSCSQILAIRGLPYRCALGNASHLQAAVLPRVRRFRALPPGVEVGVTPSQRQSFVRG